MPHITEQATSTRITDILDNVGSYTERFNVLLMTAIEAKKLLDTLSHVRKGSLKVIANHILIAEDTSRNGEDRYSSAKNAVLISNSELFNFISEYGKIHPETITACLTELAEISKKISAPES